MALFVCDECGCLDDTNTSRFWRRVLEGLSPLCSLCDPDIGKWHNRFMRYQYTGMEPVINRDEEWVAYTKEVARYNRWHGSWIESAFFMARHVAILAVLSVVAVVGGGVIALEILSQTLGK